MKAQLATVARKALGLGPLVVSPRRKYLALGLAAVADIIELAIPFATAEGVMSPVEWVIDGAIALALVLILGWNWRLALAFAAELVPGVALFPTWTAVVAFFVATDGAGQKAAETKGGAVALPEAGKGGDPAKFPGVYTRRSR